MSARSPGRPHARPESRKRPIGEREKGPEGKKASGKVEKRKSWKGKVGKKERKRDLTRQWARGPANLKRWHSKISSNLGPNIFKKIIEK